MNTKILIEQIIKSKSSVEIFPDYKDWKRKFKELVFIIHPDRCKLIGQEDAIKKLTLYKEELKCGKQHEDDAGKIIYFRDKIILEGDKNWLKVSYENYSKLKKLAYNTHFNNYLPYSYIFEDNKIIIEFDNNNHAIPLSSLSILPQEHINWILSRLLEFVCYMDKLGFTHIGINPDSIYIIPKTHGIIPISFYHVTPISNKLKTISGRYYNFYPQRTFIDKIATPEIDMELSKKSVIFIMGDRTGTGIGIRNKYNKDFVNFILTFHIDYPFEIYDKYRKMLKDNFAVKFYDLNL